MKDLFKRWEEYRLPTILNTPIFEDALNERYPDLNIERKIHEGIDRIYDDKKIKRNYFFREFINNNEKLDRLVESRILRKLNYGEVIGIYPIFTLKFLRGLFLGFLQRVRFKYL